MKLSRNEGTADRLIRVVLAAVLGVALVAGAVSAPFTYVIAIVAAVLLVTGIVGLCPLYAALGLRTIPVRRD